MIKTLVIFSGAEQLPVKFGRYMFESISSVCLISCLLIYKRFARREDAPEKTAKL